MSDELTDTIALWLTIPSLSVIVVVSFATAVGVPRWVLRRRHGRQLAKLARLPAALEGGDRLEIEWMRYKEVPKSQIRSVLRRYGWHYVGQSYEPGRPGWPFRALAGYRWMR